MTDKKIENMDFEKALTELEKIVLQLEKGEASLDDSIQYYERGMQLKKHCEGKLQSARERIEKITVDKTSGVVATEKFTEKTE